MPTRNDNIELGTINSNVPEGFAKVAAFFALDTDHSSTVFRRFDQLALRNLLYLQGRLSSLEEEQLSYDQEDLKNGDVETRKAASSWEDFTQLAKDATREREKKRMDLAIEIQKVLDLYHTALLQYSQLLSLAEPPKTTLAAYKRFFNPSDGVTRLRKESSRILDDAGDLATLHSSTGHDRLTSFVLNRMGWAFATKSGDAAIFQTKVLSRIVSVISAIMAAILLIGAVASLNYADSQYHMLILAVYAAAFAGLVTLLTSASRAEVFSASCAYVAVLVVFIGSTGGSSPSTSASV